MQIDVSHPSQTKRYRGLQVVLGLVIFLISLVAVDAHAHGCLHESADHPQHECFLTLLAQGQVEVTGDEGVVVWLVGTPVVFVGQKLTAPRDLSVRLPPSCGPPVA